MSNDYKSKQMYRDKRRHSPDPVSARDNQKSGSKKNKQRAPLNDEIDEWYDKKQGKLIDWDTTPELSPSNSMISDADIFFHEGQQQQVLQNGQPVFGAVVQETQRDELIHWEPDSYPLQITPVADRFDRSSDMEYRCRQAILVADDSIYTDLRRTLPPGFLTHFFAKILPVLKGRFAHSQRHSELIDQAKVDLQELGLNLRQVDYIHSVCQKILYRSSYGILFIKNGEFASFRVNDGTKQRTTVKGFSELKAASVDWENPWETAVRLTKVKLLCSKTSPSDWHKLDLSGIGNDWKCITFLESLVGGFAADVSDRYIGLFVIRLNENMEIKPEIPYNILEWHPIDGEYSREFYTLAPFIRYLQQHPQLLQ